METFRLKRLILLVYEALRLAFMIRVFTVLRPEGEISFPWLALITPGAMFLLMALFWLLEKTTYSIYRPLYIAGKGFSLITVIIWIFLLKGDMIGKMFISSALIFITPGIISFMLLGDFISVWLVMKIIKTGD